MHAAQSYLALHFSFFMEYCDSSALRELHSALMLPFFTDRHPIIFIQEHMVSFIDMIHFTLIFSSCVFSAAN